MPTKAQEFDQLPALPIKGLMGSPEGVIKAPTGRIVVDLLTGIPYSKQSLPEVATGWVALTSIFSGGLFARRLSGVGSPEGVVPGWPGERYLDTDSEASYAKKTGDGTTTGWV